MPAPPRGPSSSLTRRGPRRAHPHAAGPTRRTRPRPSTAATLDELFELARWAPNHNLTNPWRFRVLGPGGARARSRRRRAGGRGEARPRADARRGLRRAGRATPSTAEEDFAAGACAVYIVLLAAHARGLGGYWRTPGVLRTPEGRAACGIAGRRARARPDPPRAGAGRQARARAGAAGGRSPSTCRERPSGPGRNFPAPAPVATRDPVAPCAVVLPALLIALALPALAPAAAQAGWFPAEPVDGPSADIVERRRPRRRRATAPARWSGAGGSTACRTSSSPASSAGALAAARAGRRPDPRGRRRGLRRRRRRRPPRRVLGQRGARVRRLRAGRRPGRSRCRRPCCCTRRPTARRPAGSTRRWASTARPTRVWRASGAGGADVLRRPAAAAGRSSLLPAPLDIAPSNAAGGGTRPPARRGRRGGQRRWPRGARRAGLSARRLLGLALSRYPQEVSLPELGGAAGHAGDRRRGGRLVRLGRVPPVRRGRSARARAPARRPAVRSRRGDRRRAGRRAARASRSTAAAPARRSRRSAGGAVLAADVGARQRASARPAGSTRRAVPTEADVGVFTADARDVAVAWRRDAGDGVGRGRRPLPRRRPAVGARGRALAAASFGPVAPGSLRVGRRPQRRHRGGHAAGHGGRPARRRGRLRPAARARVPAAAAGSARRSRVLGWSGGADLWGVQGYQVLLDGAAVGEHDRRDRRSGARAAARRRPHLQVITVDRRGQATPVGRAHGPDRHRRARPRRCGVTGGARKGRPLRVQSCAAADVGLGRRERQRRLRRPARATRAVVEHGRQHRSGAARPRTRYATRPRAAQRRAATDAAGHPRPPRSRPHPEVSARRPRTLRAGAAGCSSWAARRC